MTVKLNTCSKRKDTLCFSNINDEGDIYIYTYIYIYYIYIYIYYIYIYIWHFEKGIIVLFIYLLILIPQIDRLTEEMKKIQISKYSLPWAQTQLTYSCIILKND